MDWRPSFASGISEVIEKTLIWGSRFSAKENLPALPGGFLSLTLMVAVKKHTHYRP